jgi:hypothetical protein
MKLLTRSFKTNVAVRSYAQLISNTNNYYVVAAYSDDVFGPIANTVNDICDTQYIIDRNAVFGKRITENDVVIVTRNIPWVEGNTYDMYDDKVADIENKNTYVVVDDFANSKSIFKCLFNGRIHTGNTYIVTPVSDKPTVTKVAADDEYYRTADGYVWKFICNVTEEDVIKFGNSNYVPVRPDTNVTANAVSGAIDVILIEDTGGNYQSYALGNVKLANYAGDARKVALESNATQAMFTFNATLTTSNTFIVGASANVQINAVSGNKTITGTIYSFAGNELKLLASNDASLVQSEIAAATSARVLQGTASATILTVQKDTVSALSGKNGFYNGSSIYIRGGTGAGQLRRIVSYDIIGNDRVATVDTAFTTTLTTASQYEIAPSVIISGDGTGAQAICHINSSTNGLRSVEMITRGSGYTFADVSVVGTSGMVDLATSQIISPNPAALRVIIPPRGGHGSNAYQDVYAHVVCISETFFRTDHPITNEYNKIALLANPSFLNTSNISSFDDRLLANTSILFGTTFTIGETVTQANTNYTAIVHQVSGANVHFTGVRGDISLDLTKNIVGNSSGTVAQLNNITKPNRISGTGQVLYIEDLDLPINRSSTQSETIKIVIEY